MIRLDTTAFPIVKVMLPTGTQLTFDTTKNVGGTAPDFPSEIDGAAGSMGQAASLKPTTIQDRDGNKIAFNGNTITDSVGRTVTFTSSGIQYLSANGQTVTVSYTPETPIDTPQAIGLHVTDCFASNGYGGYTNYDHVMNVTFPNSNQQYAITIQGGSQSITSHMELDALGEPIRSIYATGGNTAYAYTPFTVGFTVGGGGNCTGDARQVTSKSVCKNLGGQCSNPDVTTYAPTAASSENLQTTVTLPADVNGNQAYSIHKFAVVGPPEVGLEIEEDDFDFNGNPLRTTVNDYQPADLNAANKQDTVTTFLDVSPNLTTKTSYQYQQYQKVCPAFQVVNGWDTYCPSVNSQTAPLSQPYITTTVGFDGSSMRQDTTPSYVGGSSLYTDDGSHIFLDVSSSQISGGATLSYVEDAVGNLKEVDRAGSDIPSASELTPPDTRGLPLSQIDWNAKATTFQYTNGWYDSICSTSATTPSPSTVTDAASHTTSYQYYTCTGQLATITDPNGVVTFYQYDDLGRLQEKISARSTPQETHTQWSYPSSNEIDVASDKMSVGDGALQSVTLLDGLGRTSKTVSENTAQIDTTYDAIGRVSSVSNPYFSPIDPTYGLTFFQYDALGRRTQAINPDSSIHKWSYSGATVTETDEDGSSWMRTMDALGRVVAVTEPGIGFGICIGNRGCTRPPGANTTYGYDALGNLRNVVQSGVLGEAARERSFTYDSLSRLITSTNPETGTVCYGQWSGSTCQGGYDANGNLQYKTDARGALTSFTYDALNRLTSKSRAAVSYGNTSVAASTDLYYYDGQVGMWAVPQFVGGNSIGRLSFTRSFNPDLAGASCNLSGQRMCDDQYYGYDAMGRQNWLVDAPPSRWGSGIAVSAAAYDLAGNMTALQYPTGRIIVNGFDGAGRLQTVGTPSSPGAFVANMSYNPDSTMESMAYGNGVTETITENNRLQPCHFEATLGAASLMDRGYYRSSTTGGDPCGPQTGNNGNIFQIADNLAGNPYTQNFSYDSLKRVTTFDAPNFGGAVRHQDFNYDSFGNMASPQAYSPAGPSLVGMPSARMFANPGYDQTVWPFGSNNRLLDAVFDCVGADGASHYDAAGNMLCNGSNAGLNAQQFTWDAESRVTRMSAQHAGNTYDLTAEYTYDANGNRIRADQFAPNSSIANSWREYTYFAGMMLHDGDNTGSWTDYLYANGQKVARFSPTDTHYYLADHLGTTQMELDASGNVTWQGQFAPFGQELDDPTGTPMRFKFTSKERDTESGLDYFGARYYGSSMGRFTSPDPIKITEDRVANPNTLNLYSYAANNPLKYVDPDGQDITYFYDQAGIAGHAVIFAYNQQTGDGAIESFGPIVHSPIAAGESMFDLGPNISADDLRQRYAALTIQVSPELTQQVIDYIRANPDPSNWMAFGPNCSTQCSKILQKFKLEMSRDRGKRPKLLWNALRQQYNPNAPEKPSGGLDYGAPRRDMFGAFWNQIQQNWKDDPIEGTPKKNTAPPCLKSRDTGNCV